MADQTPTFEEALARLEEIVRRLERGDAALEESLGLFEEGTRLARRCEKLLSEAEQKVTLFTEAGETPFEKEA